MGLKDAWTKGARRAAVPIAEKLALVHLTPNQLTVGGLVLNVATAPFIITGHFVIAAIVLFLGGTCDMFDGAVARISAKVTPFGAFMDSTFDRLSEGVVLGAVGVYYAREGEFLTLGAVFIVVICSFLVSYTRARAEAIDLDCKVGFASRPERVVGLIIGFLLVQYHVLTFMVWLLAVLTTWTVIQRVLYVRRQIVARAAAEPAETAGSAAEVDEAVGAAAVVPPADTLVADALAAVPDADA
jgi:CDP-diacylglycerol---glycerol-3-phosphate 3-phosphatidyltransferase